MSDARIKQTHLKDWSMGSYLPISPEQMPQILSLAGHVASPASRGLEGRTQILKSQLDNIGPIIFKPYLRGGMMQYLLKNKYIKTRWSRARLEFNMLEKAACAGVDVPEPVFYLEKGGLFYSCWLATREILNQGTVAHISKKDTGQVDLLMKRVGYQVKKLVTAGIYHVDFHPGNVLAAREDGNLKIYVVDFDKARTVSSPSSVLDKLYVKRWNRAVKKHKLPKGLLTHSFLSNRL